MADEANLGVVRLDGGDQIRLSRVTGFLILLVMPDGDSSTTFDLDSEQARKLAAALEEGAAQLDAWAAERPDN